MNEYKITFENNDSFCTGFNGTLEEAKSYYVGNYFNLGVVNDLMVKAVKVEVI